MRIYVAGPMRGKPLYNYQDFEDATQWLRRGGHDVTSPHEIDMQLGYVRVAGTREQQLETDGRVIAGTPQRNIYTKVELTDKFVMEKALAYDLRVITQMDAIALLPGWEDSEGALKEKQVAEWIGIKVLYLEKNGLNEWLYQGHAPSVSVVAVTA
jgi:hypothetical protein